jgi:hypothetical protein
MRGLQRFESARDLEVSHPTGWLFYFARIVVNIMSFVRQPRNAGPTVVRIRSGPRKWSNGMGQALSLRYRALYATQYKDKFCYNYHPL